jgi:predicted glycogen debranching enzyme
MEYLKFDRTLMSNLDKSLDNEVLITNKAGAYASTTIVDCNTRKYHGLLVVPVPELDDENHVLLSSCDETVIQHGAEFNLGLHRFKGDVFSPNGHKYIREFHVDSVATTLYRIGGVILKKERIFVYGANRILVRYTLLEAHSPTVLRLKPFLAFRKVTELTHENDLANKSYETVENGISMCLYAGYTNLYMQTNKKVKFVSNPDWYRDIEYSKEREDGYDYMEDLFVPGYFELPIKKGEVIVFSAGTEPANIRDLKRLFDDEIKKRVERTDFHSCLESAARQFYIKKEDGYYIVAGYPWLKCRARDEFISLPGLTLAIGNIDMFDNVMINAVKAVDEFMSEGKTSTRLTEIHDPDVLLWFVWAVQQYATKMGIEIAVEKYGRIVLDIIAFIRKQSHPNLFLHDNGLVYTNGKDKTVSWMNAKENGVPVIHRSGYLVEINALWFNALKFAAQIAAATEQLTVSDLLSYQSEACRRSFVDVFWNGFYLYDFVDGDNKNEEVRPNMIFAVSLEFSPLEKQQQRSVIDMVTRELLTVKGLRSLSPKSGMYRPMYVGSPHERICNYHNGPVWPWTTAAFVEAYLKVFKCSGVSFLERMIAGLEPEMTNLTVGTLSELFDGNPPFRGHGAMSFAMSVAGVLRGAALIEDNIAEYKAKLSESEDKRKSLD